jgi:hypothetical protein
MRLNLMAFVPVPFSPSHPLFSRPFSRLTKGRGRARVGELSIRYLPGFFLDARKSRWDTFGVGNGSVSAVGEEQKDRGEQEVESLFRPE